jgi:biopolymer transport protein ExbD
MSHGGGGGGHGQQNSDPNLTPLLDLVLQLVMFFMLIANFAQEDVSDKVKLPVASQAKPLSAKDTNITYLNVDARGHVLVAGNQELVGPEQLVVHMRHIAKNQPSLTEKEAKEVMKVIIRADKDVRFRDIDMVMVAIKSVGFRHLQLRAKINP